MFKKGDTVILKSGGPTMTVKSIGEISTSPNRGVICTWFDSKNELREAVFEEEVLEADGPAAGFVIVK